MSEHPQPFMLELGFDAESATIQLQQKPQTVFYDRFFQYLPSSSQYYIVVLNPALYRRMGGLAVATGINIITGQVTDENVKKIRRIHNRPLTAKEQELMLLFDYRSTYIDFLQSYFLRMNLPPTDSSQRSFDNQCRNLKFTEKDGEISQLAYEQGRTWYEEQPDLNTPVVPDDELNVKITACFDRMNALTAFYNNNQQLMAVSTSEIREQHRNSFDIQTALSFDYRTAPLFVIRDFIQLFGNEERLQKYDKNIGFTAENFPQLNTA